MTTLDATHDRRLRSWVASANVAGCGFPIQNLPFGRFRRAGSTESWRVGTAIGDQVLDLRAAGVIDTHDMNVLMAAVPSERRALRARISAGLREGSEKQTAWASALLPQAQAEYSLPCRIGDYTDFYTGIHYATAVGKLTQGGNAPLALPNGEERTFLEDGDTLILRGYCEAEGASRIGLGEASGIILQP